MSEYRFSEQKYIGAECLFQTIEMAKSDEDYGDVEICSSTPPSIFSWKLVKRRQRPHRRYTVSHSSPPAPPSTPTSVTANSTPTPSPTAFNNKINANASDDGDELSNLLYIIDYAPKYKKKLKEQLRIDNELADLLNAVSLTTNNNTNKIDGNKSLAKIQPERGISNASRVIRKHDAGTKIFKIHRNPKEFFRDPDEENSVSAPECDDTEDETTRFRRLTRLKSSRRLLWTKRQRRFARFEHQERMDALGAQGLCLADTFDAVMTFGDEA